MTQKEFISEITRLSDENPELPIRFFVDSTEMSDSHYTPHEITRVEISPWWGDGYGLVLCEEDEIKDRLFGIFDDGERTDIEIGNLVICEYDDTVKQAICVYTGAAEL